MKLIMENFNKFLKEEEELKGKEQGVQKLKFTLSKLDDEGRLIDDTSLGSLEYTTEDGKIFEIAVAGGDARVFLDGTPIDQDETDRKIDPLEAQEALESVENMKKYLEQLKDDYPVVEELLNSGLLDKGENIYTLVPDPKKSAATMAQLRDMGFKPTEDEA